MMLKEQKLSQETHLKEKDYPLQNVKGSCYMEEQMHKLEEDKKRNRQNQEMGHECLILLLSSGFSTVRTP